MVWSTSLQGARTGDLTVHHSASRLKDAIFCGNCPIQSSTHGWLWGLKTGSVLSFQFLKYFYFSTHKDSANADRNYWQSRSSADPNLTEKHRNIIKKVPRKQMIIKSFLLTSDCKLQTTSQTTVRALLYVGVWLHLYQIILYLYTHYTRYIVLMIKMQGEHSSW